MRAFLTTALLLATLLPVSAQATTCATTPYPECNVYAGPVSAGGWVDTRWWPLEGEFYHCVDAGPEVVQRIACQSYRLA